MTTPADPSQPTPGEQPVGAAPTPPPGWGAPPSWQQPGVGQPGQWPSGQVPGGPASSDDTTWALLAHLSFFVLGILGPLVIYLVKRDTSPFVRAHAAEALNFQITITLAMIVSAILILVLIGILMIIAVVVAGGVYAVLAAVAANKGQSFRYPLTLRLVS